MSSSSACWNAAARFCLRTSAFWQIVHAARAYALDFLGHVGPVVGAREFMVDSVALYVQHGLVFRLYECHSLALRDENS